MTAANITNLPVAQPMDAAAIMERVLLAGDLSKLTTEERTSYYLKVCQSVGLNPLTRPFDYIRLSGREVLYAKRDAADQLRKINRISLEIIDRKVSGDLLVVTVRATAPDGRTDEDMGVVPVAGLKGEGLANAMLKAMTKAKRRATLSICGLGLLDETEVQSVIETEGLRASGSRSDHSDERLGGGSAPQIAPPPPPAAAKPAKPPIEINLPGGWEPARFPRNGPGLKEALEFLTAAVVDGAAEVVGLNEDLLQTIHDTMPALRAEVAELRKAAAEAQGDAAADETDDFPGDLPPGA